MSRALIVGGTGQIGWASADNLLSHGWDVTVASRSGNDGPAGSTALTLDRTDTTALLAAGDGMDLVLDTVAYGVAQGEQLAQFAGRVGSLVVISTASVYVGTNGSYLDVASDRGFPDFPVPATEASPTVHNDEQTYSPMKAALERVLLATSELPVSILRPGAIHGPHSPALREWFFIKRALDGRDAVVLGYDGLSRFGTSATANIAELVRLCGEQPGSRALNAVDDPAPTVAEIGRAIFDHLGHDAEIVTVPGDRFDSSPWSVPHPLVLSMDVARTELGYVPVGDYRATVGAAIDWATDAVARAEASGGTGQSAFPRLRADDWFDYAAEDEFLSAR